jgi:hypothetical protein
MAKYKISYLYRGKRYLTDKTYRKKKTVAEIVKKYNLLSPEMKQKIVKV